MSDSVCVYDIVDDDDYSTGNGDDNRWQPVSRARTLVDKELVTLFFFFAFSYYTIIHNLMWHTASAGDARAPEFRDVFARFSQTRFVLQ